MITIIKNHRWFLVMLAAFVFTRFFGLGQFYHQDEYRWISIANSAVFGDLSSPHPPIMEFALSSAGKFFGYENLRVVPLIFSILNLWLVYLLALRLSGGRKTAYLAVGFFIISVYGLIANLQIDIDGAILPFFVLSSYYFYLKVTVDKDKRFIWLFLAAIVGGFLAKISFLLFFVALVVHHLLILYRSKRFKVEIKKLAFSFISLILLALAVYVFYNFENSRILEYAAGFKVFNFGSRSYFDLFLRLFKFFIWLSPFLVLPVMAGLFKREIFVRHRVWFIYAIFNLVFYLVIFDFTRLPIERYFMFIIAPAVLISADILSSFISRINTFDRLSINPEQSRRINKKYLFLSLGGFLLLLIITALASYEILPLNPKVAYLDSLKSLNFNFLIPLTGGSGPIGFYVSAQFILWAWLVSFVALLASFFAKKYREIFIMIFIIFGVGYNILLSSEHLFGNLYGSVDGITKKSVDYVINNKEIEGVITYYDAGVYYLKLKNKYDSRFYTAPTRDYTIKLTEYRGHYLIVDFPAVDKKSEYWRLISRCNLDKKFTDKYVESYVFDCRALPQL